MLENNRLVAEYILENEKYYPRINKNKQDNWILAFLHKSGWSRNDACDFFVNLKKKDANDNGDSAYVSVFNSKWEKCYKKVRFSKYDAAEVYQDEIDLINSCDLRSSWHFMLLFALLVDSKLNNKKEMLNIWFSDYAKLIGKRRDLVTESVSCRIFREGIRVGLFNTFSKEIFNAFADDDEDLFQNRSGIVFNWKKRKEKPVARIISMSDIIDFQELFIAKRTCEKCGVVFEITPNCQRNICEECYKIDLAERHKRSNKKWYSRISDNHIVEH